MAEEKNKRSEQPAQDAQRGMLPERKEIEEEKEEKKERKQEEKEEKDGKSESTNRYFFIGMALIVVIAAAIYFLAPVLRGIAGPDRQDYYKYNNFVFQRYKGIWFTEVQIPGMQAVPIPLHYGPRELENVSLQGRITRLDVSHIPAGETKSTYLTFDPDEENYSGVVLAISELAEILSKVLRVESVAACTKNITEACHSRPIINCDENQDNPIIYISANSPTMVRLDGNCITIQGEGLEVVRAADRFIYQWLGIMN